MMSKVTVLVVALLPLLSHLCLGAPQQSNNNGTTTTVPPLTSTPVVVFSNASSVVAGVSSGSPDNNATVVVVSLLTEVSNGTVSEVESSGSSSTAGQPITAEATTTKATTIKASTAKATTVEATTAKAAAAVATTATTTTTSASPGAPSELNEGPKKPVAVERLGPVVATKSGKLRPLILQSRKGREYYAFKGVPFSNPPIQFQRFKPPAPKAPWEGVLNATKFAPACTQYNIVTEEFEGEEDCLYLNVYTPKLGDDTTTKFPVMVFIHQGAFMFGSSADYEGKYLMDEDVVFVTIAYRLGAFGFLNTEGGDAEGNMGLKDQVLALQWVQDNIDKFNGEKNQVTIMGESAGGASVHYHLLSERSRDYFARAISMSGTALSPWAFTRSPKKNAKKLATMLNCPTMDMSELFNCLQTKEASEIVHKQKEFFEWGTDPITPFGPSIEVTLENQSPFIKESPYSLMSKGQINPQPWMLGVVQDVCLLDAWSILLNPQLVADMNVDWHRVAPLTLDYRETAFEADAVSNQIRAFYFGSEAIGNGTASNLTNLYSDRWFNHGTRTSAIIHGKMNEAVPVYLYLFGYKGKDSHLKFLNIEDKQGVSEGDELQYLFNMENRFSPILEGEADAEFSEKFIKLWLSFARDGKPSTDICVGPKWVPMSTSQVKGDEALMFYKVDANCSYVDEPFSSRMSFWDNLPLNEMNHELEHPYARRDSI